MGFIAYLLRQRVDPPVAITLLTATCTLAAGLVRLVFSRTAGAPPPTLGTTQTRDAGIDS